MYIYIYIYIYICIYIIHTHVHTQTQTHTHRHTDTQTQTHRDTCTGTGTDTDTDTDTHGRSNVTCSPCAHAPAPVLQRVFLSNHRAPSATRSLYISMCICTRMHACMYDNRPPNSYPCMYTCTNSQHQT